MEDKSKDKYTQETTDAIEMMGSGYEPAAIIEQPRAVKVLRDDLGEEWTVAWVKLSTAFKPHIKEIRGAPLAVWLYISLCVNKQGISYPSINKIAEDTGYSRNGVMDAVKTLEEKGYLTVRRGEKKYNLYEPEFAAIGKNNEPSNESIKWTGPVSEPNESTFSPDESSGVDLNKRNKIKQETYSDPLWDLQHGKKPTLTDKNKKTFEEMQAVEDLLNEMERGLKVNIKRSTQNQVIAKKILKDGRPFGKWLTWCNGDEWRASHLYIYADLWKVWEIWPQAFRVDERPEYKPVKREEVNAVPNPFKKPRLT